MIPIQNIYYMLSYAFQVLNEKGYKSLATEKFHNVEELMAAILSRGITNQVKRGLGKEYISHSELLFSLRGKLDISESIKMQTMIRNKMVCLYDEFSENSEMNRIIKSTVKLLMRMDITKARKKELRKLMVYFRNVDTINLYTVNWNINYNRNNQTYKMLISICHLIVKGLLHSKTNGKSKLMDFDEKRKARLYEKFILEYYRAEFPELKATASQIKWQLDDDSNAMIPVMQTDATLTYNKKILIIDAKYYSRATQLRHGTHKIHSANLYQIFSYVKNKKAELSNTPYEVSGMLLYAKTDEAIFPNNDYQMSGNKISVKSIDLNCPFSEIANQLDSIALDHFEIKGKEHKFIKNI